MISKFLTIVLLSSFLIGCASSTEKGAVGIERKQLLLLSSEQMNSLSASSYSKVKKEAAAKGKLDSDKTMAQRVSDISKKLIPHTGVFRKDAPEWKWEVHVIADPTVNAYCMPGGKIMFYSGIIEKLSLTDGEIAAIMGHEIAHALREHGRERISGELLKNLGLIVLISSGKVDKNTAGAAGLLSTLFITLPNSRENETEADKMGLELMARGGYDPNEAVTLWRKMAAHSGGKTPEFLSTHPSSERRIHDLGNLVDKVEHLYLQTKTTQKL